MQEKNKVVQEAFIQMKQVEEAIAENAKGILQSTMKEEISQLVKESLSEQDDEMEVDLDADVESDDLESDDEMDADNDEMDTEMDLDMDVDMDSEESPIDLTDASDEEILKVFKAMGEEDGIIIKKDGNDIHLSDNDADVEYLVKLGESEDEKHENMNYEMDEAIDDVIDAIFAKGDVKDVDSSDVDMEDEFEMEEESEMDEESDMEEVVYEIEMDEESEMEEEFGGKKGDDSKSHKDYMQEEDDDEDDEEDEDELDESYNPSKAKKGEAKEGKMSIKPKGVDIGKGPGKIKYKPAKGGFKEDKKEAPKAVGTGKAKFDYKEGENMDGDNKIVKKAETKEAARTYGMGSKEGRGLRKGITNNRNYVYKNGVTVETLESEITILREKNDEYRKALNTFREKLTEVAIFNSNLAYATRLFTEHSTTKKEKINILRRFDNVETIKESKNLYRSIKDELTKGEGQSINESVETKLNKTVSTGSSTTLIESKTYENPQFLRMKDLMSKIR